MTTTPDHLSLARAIVADLHPNRRTYPAFQVEILARAVLQLVEERDRLNGELAAHANVGAFSVEGLAHALRLRLGFATEEERMAAIAVVREGFCNGCGCDVPPRCHCENDE